jgi:uncharacterized protein (UPF0332 family)
MTTSPRLLHKEMLDISKSSKEQLERFKRGVFLEHKTGKSIEQLKTDACVARFQLANRFMQYAKAAYKNAPEQSRLVIGRSYYSMYHAARAVVFIRVGGDDHETHAILPNHLPDDFPDRNLWLNSLRNARLERNRADYDPYPKSEKSFSGSAANIYSDCATFMQKSKTYLISKGIRA